MVENNTWAAKRNFKWPGLQECEELDELDVKLFILQTLDLRDPKELGLEGGLFNKKKTH